MVENIEFENNGNISSGNIGGIFFHHEEKPSVI